MTNQINQSDLTAQKSRLFFLFYDFILPILILICFTFIFRNSNIDISILSKFYNSSKGWFLKSHPIVQFIYRYGNFPALILSLSGLMFLIYSFRKVRWIKWRKIGLFLGLTMILGPGLIINVLLKDHWGRPRPRNITFFGGKYKYEQVVSIDTSSKGQSFPCGHASMGFYLFIPWFLLRKYKPLLAKVSLWTGLLAGTTIGFVRIAQGGHFPSDVIWAGGLVYLTGSVLFYLLKMQRSIWFYARNAYISPTQKTLIAYLIGVFAVLIILGVMLATPYSKEKIFVADHINNDSVKVCAVNVNSIKADVYIRQSDSLVIQSSAEGFGFPTSKLRSSFKRQMINKMQEVSITQRLKGIFTEFSNELMVCFPTCDSLKTNISIQKGSIVINLPEKSKFYNLNIFCKEGTIELNLDVSTNAKLEIFGNATIIDKQQKLNHLKKENSSQKVLLSLEKGKIIIK